MKPAAANGMPKGAPKKYNIALDKGLWAAYYNIVISRFQHLNGLNEPETL